jgi:NADPH-dependent 2,4-dienoyl-CoA reductase/sulfur reductase-like enzyme/nitrite reductase/ring-hydroxylating ferredoxin subunit
MGGEQKLTGPDLGQGIDESDLADGAMLVGHKDGEGVLLARRGSDVFAIGSTCTHYSGPLGDGLLVGDTVRCPWHHACFSLHTGEAIAAPALNPVPCYSVQKREGKLYVLGKVDVPKRIAPSGTPDSIAIVGAGAAGNAAAEMLRHEGYTGSITLIGADESVPYDRPNLSKDYLAGNAPEEWIPLRPLEFYAERKIELLLGTKVTSIDTSKKSLTLDNGKQVAYGALLLAMGAEPVRLKLPGGDLPHVHYLRTLADSRALIAALEGKKRAVIVGAGFIGLEVAASLRTRGLEVTVVEPETVPLARVMGPELGRGLQKLHEEHGVVFQLGQKPASIDASSLTLENGQRLPADLVVIGVGVRPSIALAQAAGLTIDRGVVVNEYLETSQAGVYAVGDLARFPDVRTGDKIRVEHWVVAERQGQAAAKNLLGMQQRFRAVPFFWSAHYDVTVSYVGHAEKWDRVDVAGDIEKRDCAIAFRRENVTLAVATLGRDNVSLEAEAAMERNDEAALQKLV